MMRISHTKLFELDIFSTVNAFFHIRIFHRPLLIDFTYE
jgi:hypothetical protein